MAQNAPITVKAVNSDNSEGGLVFTPLRSRNGVFEYGGKTHTGNMPFTNQAAWRATASVRQGTLADPIKKTPRVKRRVNLKLELPLVAGMNTDGTLAIDFINVDVVLSAPVVANEDQLRTALLAPYSAAFEGTSPLKDLVVSGNEPY